MIEGLTNNRIAVINPTGVDFLRRPEPARRTA
jgi:hypothetical protein